MSWTTTIQIAVFAFAAGLAISGLGMERVHRDLRFIIAGAIFIADVLIAIGRML